MQITPLSDALGAEVTGIDLRQPLDEQTAEGLYQAWLEHIVLVYRNQTFSQENQIRFTEYFGERGYSKRPKQYESSGQKDLVPGIMLISNVRKDGEPIGSLPDGELMFHHDMIHSEIPHKGTLLYGVEVPSRGGHTKFANGYQAYDTLPDDLKERLKDQKALHHYNYGSQQRGDQIGTPAFAESTHPVFCTHPETGRKTIYVNRLMTDCIVGMPTEESDRLLLQIFDHAEQPIFVYEHAWRKGDLVMWDNRCSMHARTDFPSAERRLMWRSTIQGTERPS